MFESRETTGPKRKTARGKNGRRAETGKGHHILTAATMIGDRVRNERNETVGRLEDLMIDFESGRIVYGVLSVGGFLGIGNKLFAIPINMLHLDDNGRQFTLEVNRDILRKAPGFEKDDWPNFIDRRWEREIHDYFGVTPYWKD